MKHSFFNKWILSMGLITFCPPLMAQDSGRYQLLTAVLENTAGIPVTKVFKLDTATGRSWVYQLGSGGNLNEPGKWMEIPGPSNEVSQETIQKKQIANQPDPSSKEGGSTVQPKLSSEIPPQSVTKPEVPPAVVAQLETAQPETPSVNSKIKPESVKNVRDQLDEYNRIIQWAMINVSGAWVPDGKGGKAYMPPEDVEKLKIETEAKKKNLLEGLRFFGRPRPKSDPNSP